MKKQKRLLFLSLVALVLILSACGKTNDTDNTQNQGNMKGMDHSKMNMSDSSTSGSHSSSNKSSSEEVNVVASNWKWQLSKTTFKVGQPVNFSIQGKDGVHGFSIKGTNINEQVAAGETKKVTWTPDKAGEYTIECSIVCGTGHTDMVQKIKVN